MDKENQHKKEFKNTVWIAYCTTCKENLWTSKIKEAAQFIAYHHNKSTSHYVMIVKDE